VNKNLPLLTFNIRKLELSATTCMCKIENSTVIKFYTDQGRTQLTDVTKLITERFKLGFYNAKISLNLLQFVH